MIDIVYGSRVVSQVGFFLKQAHWMRADYWQYKLQQDYKSDSCSSYFISGNFK